MFSDVVDRDVWNGEPTGNRSVVGKQVVRDMARGSRVEVGQVCMRLGQGTNTLGSLSRDIQLSFMLRGARAQFNQDRKYRKLVAVVHPSEY